MSESEEKEEEGKMEQLGHYAHVLHCSLEGVEGFLHEVHIVHAVSLIRIHEQMARDLRIMRAGLSVMYKCVRQYKNAKTPKLLARLADAEKKLSEAKALIAKAEDAFNAERGAVAEANRLLKFRKLAGMAKEGSIMVKVSEATNAFTKALQASRVGANVLKGGRFLVSPAFTKGLIGVGVIVEAFASWNDTTATTTGGKVANTVIGGGTGALTLLNPFVAVGDLLAPKGYKLSEVYHGGSTAVSSLIDAGLSGNTKAAEDFHERSMQGHYGKVMQVSSEAGEFWADKGIYGGLCEFGDALKFWR